MIIKIIDDSKHLIATVCENCGNPLDLARVDKGSLPCRFCGIKYHIRYDSDSFGGKDLLKRAQSDLFLCKWDDAEACFLEALKTIDDVQLKAATHFSIALAKYGIQYIFDHVNNRAQPIVHRLNSINFTADSNYKQAIALATLDADKKEYQAQGKDIDAIYEEFKKLEARSIDYDTFICVKVSDPNKTVKSDKQIIEEFSDDSDTTTLDSKHAHKLYSLLVNSGKKPFFSEMSLFHEAGCDYEAHILYALHKAKSLIIVCYNQEYLKTPWVKNEYSRYISMLNDKEKNSDSIMLINAGNPIDRLGGKKIGENKTYPSNPAIGMQVVNFVEKHLTSETQAKLDARNELEERLEKAEQETKKAKEEAELARKQSEIRAKEIAEQQIKDRQEAEKRAKEEKDKQASKDQSKYGKLPSDFHFVTERRHAPNTVITVAGNAGTPKPCTLPDGTQGIEFGVYPQEASATWDDKSTHTPIQWRVLEKYNDGTALLLSDKILDCVRYHRDFVYMQWRDSDIRKWLNGEGEFRGKSFIEKAFSPSEQGAISTVSNSGNGFYDQKKDLAYSAASCADTQDKVFLLNVAQAHKYFGKGVKYDWGYGTTDKAAQTQGTAYAKLAGSKKGRNLANEGDKLLFEDNGEWKGNSLWWLRNSGSYSEASVVCINGLVFAHGERVSHAGCGVRPAIRVRL